MMILICIHENFSFSVDIYLELWKDLNSIHPDLLCTDDAEINSQVHKLILQLGVKELFPSNIISHHILPVLQGDEWKVFMRFISLFCLIWYVQTLCIKSVSFFNGTSTFMGSLMPNPSLKKNSSGTI